MSLTDQIKILVDNVTAISEDSAQEQRTLIADFLSSTDNQIIRVYVTDTSGMGHQSNTVMIMYRLIQLGFNHNFEVVYAESEGDNLTANKLSKLIPGFMPDGNNPVTVTLSTDPKVDASMIPLTYFKTNIADYPIKYFGFTGGYDKKSTNLANAPTNTDPGVNVSFFLKLQPYQWPQQNTIQRFGIADPILLETVAVLGAATYQKKRGYFINPAQPPPQNAFTGTSQDKYVPYQTIINASKSTENPINLLPVYGIGGSEASGVTDASPNIRSQNVLFDLITAVRYAQRFGSGNQQRGAIIVNIANIPDTAYDSLNELLTGAAPDLTTLNEMVTQLPAIQGDLATHSVEIIDYFNPALADKIALLNGTDGTYKILVVKMGGIPVSAFNYMYSLSTLPCVLEGKATANMVLNMNIPYLNILKDSKVVYPTLPLNATADCQQAKDCNNVSASFKVTPATMNTKMEENPFSLDPPSDGFKTTPAYIISDYIARIYNTSDALNTYFTDLQAFFQNQQQDKLYLGLLYFISYKDSLNTI
ncbi:hypothetical protein E6C50_02920 [Flavobacterium supellecticarium]|uniref:Uncharacterized protein n=1 Tax=Flavobacterium supellecticarium TaxID=2565924 RepID=A0A4S4A400_9FLAO|nr:hypothetical protein [Flavobacterium supellecticarium]THF53170.1 hypothetical protein E6C50_02920 [Flavobacterium supellecticarium]